MSELLQEQTEVREQFVVDNDMKAEWCLSKIRKIREDQQTEIAELERQMQFYKDQKEMITAKADSDASFFEGMLQGYFNRRQEDGFTKATKTQVSYKLPSGKLMMKHREPKFDVHDAETVAWLKENKMTDFIKVTEEVNWKELKKAVTVTGEAVTDADGQIIPGIEVTEREDEFVVEVAK